MSLAATSLSLVYRLAVPRDAGAFRLWLALVVVVHHVTRVEIGKAPVLVFFTLSGYWVHQAWHSRYVRTRNAWATFVVSRWWRVAPVLMLSSVICIAAHAFARDADWTLIRNSAPYQAVSAGAVLGYAQLITRPVGPAWSLDVEMQFYLVAPLLALFVRRLSALVVLVVAAASFVFAMAAGVGVSLPSFLVFFLLGMVAAERKWQISRRLAYAGFALAVGLVLLALSAQQGHALIGEGGGYSAIFNVALGLLALPFALTTVSRRSDAFDRALGEQSYLVYMLHWPAIIVLRFVDFSGIPRPAVAAISLSFAMALCLAVWRWFDRPLDRCRVNWVRARIIGAAPPLAGEKRKKGDSAAIFA